MQGGEITEEAKTRRQKNPISTVLLISGFGMHFPGLCSSEVKKWNCITTSYDQIIK